MLGESVLFALDQQGDIILAKHPCPPLLFVPRTSIDEEIAINEFLQHTQAKSPALYHPPAISWDTKLDSLRVIYTTVGDVVKAVHRRQIDALIIVDSSCLSREESSMIRKLLWSARFHRVPIAILSWNPNKLARDIRRSLLLGDGRSVLLSYPCD